ncbi:energy-coupling factor transporter ATPase [Mycoplasmopsis phocirhinis]|uniref:Energy-coupling factor transporter ATP-binding protein EcfA2 n=1 Tax=Mycoplasmopsis phocirhinis TaxID=142650 RepID=A0A4V0ZAF7_9BACT|nr:energy-coupling factor transporter ATPase [Mycoplasmopsis phocirhinis]QBF34542.1 energy-coupling factor transporter ATPase [Mycoplasmopsis phocirhinis]
MEIKIRQLSHTYSRGTRMEFTSLKDVNLNINQGEFIGVIGQTGSGKSTLVEHLNALLLPTKGSIQWNFKNIKKNKNNIDEEIFDDQIELKASWIEKSGFRNGSKIEVFKQKKLKKVKRAKEIRKKVAIAFQFAEYQLFEETIEKDIMFGPLSFGVDKTEAKNRAQKYLNLCGLDDSFLAKSPFNLSGGQKRRVALAGILAIEPDIIVADEPTAGLDPVGVQEILEIFTKLNKLGKTIVIVTHDLDNVLQVTSRVLLMKDGRLIKDGTTREILRDTEFLNKNSMQPPKILEFITKLQQRGLNVPHNIKNIDELANFLNQKLAQKRGK